MTMIVSDHFRATVQSAKGIPFKCFVAPHSYFLKAFGEAFIKGNEPGLDQAQIKAQASLKPRCRYMTRTLNVMTFGLAIARFDCPKVISLQASDPFH